MGKKGAILTAETAVVGKKVVRSKNMVTSCSYDEVGTITSHNVGSTHPVTVSWSVGTCLKISTYTYDALQLYEEELVLPPPLSTTDHISSGDTLIVVDPRRDHDIERSGWKLGDEVKVKSVESSTLFRAAAPNGDIKILRIWAFGKAGVGVPVSSNVDVVNGSADWRGQEHRLKVGDRLVAIRNPLEHRYFAEVAEKVGDVVTVVKDYVVDYGLQIHVSGKGESYWVPLSFLVPESQYSPYQRTESLFSNNKTQNDEHNITGVKVRKSPPYVGQGEIRVPGLLSVRRKSPWIAKENS